MATTRKTKDELLTELKKAEEKIHDLTKELEQCKQRESVQKAADAVAMLKDSFIESGFSPEEAFELTRTTLENGLKAGMGR